MIATGIFLLSLVCTTSALSMSMSTITPKKVLIIGGTRFAGLWLWKELLDRGHQVTLFNRGKTALAPLPRESEEQFNKRKSSTRYIAGDRTNPDSIKEKLGNEQFDVVYDMNGREAVDTMPVADLFNGKVECLRNLYSCLIAKEMPKTPRADTKESSKPKRT
jgi:nucleoside-diphosphate-sugar epimerase